MNQANEKRNKPVDLLKITNQYLIFIDTCVWMYPPSKELLTKILPEALFVRKATVKLPHRVIEEINRKLGDSDTETRKRAKFASKMVGLYIKSGLVQVLGDDDDPFTDQTILYVFQKYSDRHHLCLFTRDRKLANGVHDLSKQEAVSLKNFLLFGVAPDGSTYQWEFDEKDQQKKVIFQYQNKPKQAILAQNSFELPERVQLPKVFGQKTLDQVFTLNHGSFHLGDRIGEGEHGTVYKAAKGYACKIFNSEQISEQTYQKLAEMLKTPVADEAISWPLDLVFNEQKEFIGYMMRQGRGESLQRIIKTKPYLLKRFPDWTRKNLIELSLTILRHVAQLHDKGIVIASLDMDNILIDSDKKLTFINTDGFQVGSFQGERFLVNFTPPELMDSEPQLHSIQHDLYGIAVLMFQILLPGKLPYAFQGSGSRGEHISDKPFQFTFNPRYMPRYEQSTWNSMWAGLPYHLQQLFYETFTNSKRFPLEVWEKALRFYKDSLKSGELPSEIFPNGLALSDEKNVQVKCESCKTFHLMRKRELERLKELSKYTICEGCYKQFIREETVPRTKEGSKKAIKPGRAGWEENISFLNAIASYRDEI